MRNKSFVTSLLNRIALCSAIFAVVVVANVAAQNRPFLNVSSRAQVLTGDNVLISGFIITTTATTTKQVLIRGLGPSTGVKFSLTDPMLTLNGPNGFIPITNNNWRDTQEFAIQATGLAPGNNLDSAILVTLPPGQYTATLAGNNGGTGVGVLEVYDLGGPAQIVNLSARALVGTGNNVLIGGMIIGAPGTRAVIRGMGPSLSQYGVQGALQNPLLELYNSQGALMASNDNWASGPDQAEITYLGLSPGTSYPNESALLATLTPGNYTAIVKGVNNTTGIGLVEMYALPDPKYPKIFQCFASADALPEPFLTTVARHDLMWNIPRGFGWGWVDPNTGVDTDDYTTTTISSDPPPHYPITYDIAALRALNPDIKILASVEHWAAQKDTGYQHLPGSHTWWKRQYYPNGPLIPLGPLYPNSYLLNNDDPNYRAHVAAQAAAVMATGKFDGVFLDTCPQGSYLLPLLTAVRDAIGPYGLIIINGNADIMGTQELGLVNGVMMEAGIIEGGPPPYYTWQDVKTALIRNEQYTREPKVNCLENRFITSRTDPIDMKRMRATTTMSLTLSRNGYALFANFYHEHMWYDFWSNHSLGVALKDGENYPGVNYATKREFKNGTAVWNAAQNTTLPVSFPQMRRSLATGQTGFNFNLTGIDGDIYLFYP